MSTEHTSASQDEGGDSIAQIETDIAQTRAQLAHTVDALTDKLNPRTQAHDLAERLDPRPAAHDLSVRARRAALDEYGRPTPQAWMWTCAAVSAVFVVLAVRTFRQ